MTDHRFLDISREGVRLRLESKRLRVEKISGDSGVGLLATFPLADLDAVVMAQGKTMVSGLALAGLAKEGCGVVVCDEKFLPVGMLLPLTGHTTRAERFRAQADAPLALRKQLWKSIVKAKIHNQGTLLRELTGDDGGLLSMAGKVKSGDSGNLEAQAAQRYWKRLFPRREKPFVRNRDAEDENALLNYGYAVLRASTARAVCAAGLHPGLGVYHHNRYDAYCLADDLMEPFRPLVDGVVAAYGEMWGMESRPRVDAVFKNALIFELGSRFRVGGERRTLFDILGHAASSMAKTFLGVKSELYMPYLKAPLLSSCLGEETDAEGLGPQQPGEEEE